MTPTNRPAPTSRTRTLADDWIATDPYGVVDDLRRLGLEEAADYNLDLIAGCLASGDTRWTAITRDQLLAALADLRDRN